MRSGALAMNYRKKEAEAFAFKSSDEHGRLKTDTQR